MAILLACCTGCQSPNFLADRLGQSTRDRLAQIKKAADQTNPSRPGLPPPTNADPQNAAASTAAIDEHLRLGELELSKDRKLEALAHFQKAIDVDPQNPEANHRMAVVCDKLGEFDRAEKHYKLALQKEPTNVAVLSDLGYSYWLQGRHAESERFLLKALEVNPQYETAIANLGMLYGSTGRQDEALAMFRKIGEESQVQQIMQQVAAMSASASSHPDLPFSSTSPEGAATSGFAQNPASQEGVQNASFETPGDGSQINGPTRELLELMEQGRRQQQLAGALQRQDAAPGGPPPSVASDAYPAADFASQPLPGQQQLSGGQSFAESAAAAQHGPHQPVPDHMLNRALAEIDRAGRQLPNGRPITIGPNTPSQALGVNPQQPAPSSPSAGSENWWDANPPASETGPGSALPVNPLSSPPSQQLNSASRAEPHASLPHNHAVATPWQNAGQAPPTVISYGNSPSAAQFAESGMTPQQLPPQTGMSAQPVPELAERPFDFANRSPARPQAATMMQAAPGSPVGEALAPQERLQTNAGPQWQFGSANPGGVAPANTADPGNGQPPAAVPWPRTPADQWPLASAAEGNADDPHLAARRQAALMGLRAGPGEMFPYVDQSQQATAGMGSRWNGGDYSQPRPYPPADVTVPQGEAFIPVPPVAQAAGDAFSQMQPMPYGANRVNLPPHYDIPGSGALETAPRSIPQSFQPPPSQLPMYAAPTYAASQQSPMHQRAAATGANHLPNLQSPGGYPAQVPAGPAALPQQGVPQTDPGVGQQYYQPLNGAVGHYGQGPQPSAYRVAALASHTMGSPVPSVTTPPPWNSQASVSVGGPASAQGTVPPGDVRPMEPFTSASSRTAASQASTYVVPEPYPGHRTAQRQQLPQ